MKQALIYNELVRFYNRSRRKLQSLAIEGKNLRKQNILQRRIARLFKTLTGLQRTLKLGMTTAALSAGILLFQPNTAEAQPEITFGSVQTNPFGLAGYGWYSTPAFTDLDGDGDMDMMSGRDINNFNYFQNTGTASTPVFANVQTNPFGLTDGPMNYTPTFADLDGDGDLDIMAGEYYGNFMYFQNTGTLSAPAFAAAQFNPFGLTSIASNTAPTFADLDGDGDMDLMTGEWLGGFFYFQNIGTADAPAFAVEQINPFGLTSIPGSTPTFADLDGDGDLDIMSGGYYGNFIYFQNTGTAYAPDFAAAQTNPFGLTDIGYSSTPAFADLDEDGDMDMLAGEKHGSFFYFENTTPESSSCAIPTNLSATNITSSSATLNWDAAAEAEGYKIRYKVSGTDPWTLKYSNGNSKNLNNLSSNTNYTWEVKTYCTINPGSSSDWSAKQKFTTGSLRLGDESVQQTSFQIYPNPAEDHATIQFTLAQTSHVYIKVYDVSGREIATLLDDDVEQGEHSVVLNTNHFSKGVYMVRMIEDFGIVNQKLIVQ